MNTNLYNVATQAVYVLQYSTKNAIRYVQSQLPNVSEVAAKTAVTEVVRSYH